jgi:hypothetical protein
MVIVVDGVMVPTKGQFDVATLVDEKKMSLCNKKVVGQPISMPIFNLSFMNLTKFMVIIHG